MAIVARSERQSFSPRSHTAEMSLNVLRAGTFLIIYNLMESSMRTAIEAIHDDLIGSRVEFQQLVGPIKKEIVRGFKKHAKPDVQVNMTHVPSELVSAALSIEDHFNGNVDARLIKKIAETYLFSIETDTKITRGGSMLLTVKNTRNDLAHGLKSYDEIGREYTARDLLEMSIRSAAYIEQILANISDYLDQKMYLHENHVANVAA